MALSEYHQKYAGRSDEEIQKRQAEKERELEAIFSHPNIHLNTQSDVIRIAVLGCGDKRFVKSHKEIFERVLKKPVQITNFDIVTDHLAGEENIVQHDVTQPLPGGPYDITFGHVLLKFIETEKQWNVLENSFTALKQGGMAIHILDTEDYTTTSPKLPDGYFPVPLERWKKKLVKEVSELEIYEVSLKYGLALALVKARY